MSRAMKSPITKEKFSLADMLSYAHKLFFIFLLLNHKLPLLYKNQDKLRIKTPKLALDNYQDLSSLQPKHIKTLS